MELELNRRIQATSKHDDPMREIEKMANRTNRNWQNKLKVGNLQGLHVYRMPTTEKLNTQ